MAYFFIAFVVLAIGFSIIKPVKKRKLPSNHYTPFDEIAIGKSDKD
ncbi:hypothetical protein ABN702_15625 [Bacillus haimaensis]